MINVKQIKVTLPKNISEKYNQPDDTGGNTDNASLNNSKIISQNEVTNFIINPAFANLNNGVNNLNNANLHSRSAAEINSIHSYSQGGNNLFSIREEYSLKEILNVGVISEMKAKLRRDHSYKHKEGNESYLRSPEKSINAVLADVNDRVNAKIKADKVNLIYYLNSKKKVSEVLINKLSSFDEERMIRVNKICQKVAQSSEKDLVFHKIIQNKIQAKNIKEKDDYRKTLIRMENDVKKEGQILQNNIRPPDDKERYYYLHKEFQKKWERYKVNHLFDRKFRNLKSINETELPKKECDDINSSCSESAETFY